MKLRDLASWFVVASVTIPYSNTLPEKRKGRHYDSLNNPPITESLHRGRSTDLRYPHQQGQSRNNRHKPYRSAAITTKPSRQSETFRENGGILASKELKAKYINAGSMRAENIFADEIYGDVIYSDVLMVLDKKSLEKQRQKHSYSGNENTNQYKHKKTNVEKPSHKNYKRKKRRRRKEYHHTAFDQNYDQFHSKRKVNVQREHQNKRKFDTVILDVTDNHPFIPFQNGFVQKKKIRKASYRRRPFWNK